MEEPTNNINGPTDSTVVLENRGLHYANSSVSSASSPVSVPSPIADLGLKYRFWAGEVLGTLFVLALAAYVFIVPASLSRPARISAFLKRSAKRLLDIIGASIGLLVTVPFWLLIAFAIKIDSPGPIFYTQMRIAVNRRKQDRRCFHRRVGTEYRCDERRHTDFLGTPFNVIKFRSMIHEAEQQSGPVWAVKSDLRVTRVGNFLRKTHLDELPQFVNVLRGEMALVGPRPERPTFVAELSRTVEGYSQRLEVKPGITGLAQISNGYDDSIDSVKEKVRIDLKYINEQSIWTDVGIMARTVLTVITGRKAY